MRKPIIQRYIRYFQRPILAFFRMPGSRGFGILLIIFAIILIASFTDIRLNYVHPETGQRLDTVAAMYLIFTLLVLETAFPLPDSWLTRIAYFAVPITGALVLGQGLVRLGNTLLNRDMWNRAMASTYKDYTIVCGLGKVSQKVVQWILDMNEETVVIESSPNNPFLEEIRRSGVPVIIGDARRPEILQAAAIEQAESIVPCTNDDLVNLSVALEARRLVPEIKVVLQRFFGCISGSEGFTGLASIHVYVILPCRTMTGRSHQPGIELEIRAMIFRQGLPAEDKNCPAPTNFDQVTHILAE